MSNRGESAIIKRFFKPLEFDGFKWVGINPLIFLLIFNLHCLNL